MAKGITMVTSFIGVICVVQPSFIFGNTSNQNLNFVGIICAVVFAITGAYISVSLKNLGNMVSTNEILHCFGLGAAPFAVLFQFYYDLKFQITLIEINIIIFFGIVCYV